MKKIFYMGVLSTLLLSGCGDAEPPIPENKFIEFPVYEGEFIEYPVYEGGEIEIPVYESKNDN